MTIQCSRTCDVGTMTRTLKCQMMNDQGGITVLPMSICEHYKVIKPATKMKCNFDKTCVGKHGIKVVFRLSFYPKIFLMVTTSELKCMFC